MRLNSRFNRIANLVDLFFIGQYVLASLMAPSFAASAITGEKERKTYEMLLASPLKPSAISLGKLFASLVHLTLLIFASLPIVMLCLPLGGVDLREVLAAWLPSGPINFARCATVVRDSDAYLRQGPLTRRPPGSAVHCSV